MDKGAMKEKVEQVQVAVERYSMNMEAMKRNAEKIEHVRAAVERYSTVFATGVNFRSLFAEVAPLSEEQVQRVEATLEMAKRQLGALVEGLLPPRSYPVREKVSGPNDGVPEEKQGGGEIVTQGEHSDECKERV